MNIYNIMQIIDKPKQFKLPYKLHQRLITSQTQTKIPELFNLSKELRKILTQKKQNKDNNITIIIQNGRQFHRTLINDSISKNMGYQLNKNCKSKLLPQELIHKLKQPIKALPYHNHKFKLLYRIVTYTFGENFKVSPKDLLAAQGTFSSYLYAFFTNTSYQPYSYCCKSFIYLKVRNHTFKLFNLYKKQQNDQQFDSQKFKATCYYICSKCWQIVLTINIKTKNFEQKTYISNRQKQYMRQQKQKICMSIMISSGKFKNIRIDSISNKNYLNNQTISHQDDKDITKNSRTFQLSSLMPPIKYQSVQK